MSTLQPAIGIDLGTITSCVGVWKNGQAEIVANRLGQRTTPSVVGFRGEEVLVGSAAVNQASRNIENTIYDVKRFIGKTNDCKGVEEDKSHCSFRFSSGADGFVAFDVDTADGKTRTVTSQEIISILFQELKDTAAAYLGAEPKSAVITVPPHFTEKQREVVQEAAKKVGLVVLRLLNEPTAAAIGYDLDQGTGQKHVLVFDMGGAMLDASILIIENGIMEIKAARHNNRLGGENFDDKLVEHFCNEFSRKHQADLRQSKRAMTRLRLACERVKKVLSNSTQAGLEVDSIHEGIDYFSNIKRARFEGMCLPVFREISDLLDEVLEAAQLRKEEIDDVIMVGGCSRIPKVESLVEDYFNKKPTSSINTDEVITMGATIQAYILSHDNVEGTSATLLLDKSSHSIGFETSEGIMNVVIPKGSTLPCKRIVKAAAIGNSAHFRILEGDSHDASKCHLIGELSLPKLKKENASLAVIFDITEDNDIHVTVTSACGSVAVLKGDRESHEHVVSDSSHDADHEINLELCKAFDILLRIQCSIDKFMATGKLVSKVPPTTPATLLTIKQQIGSWVSSNRSASLEEVTAKTNEFISTLRPLLEPAYHHAPVVAASQAEQDSKNQDSEDSEESGSESESESESEEDDLD